MKKYNLKKFSAVGGKFSVKITISKPGGFSFSSGFYSKYDVSEYNAISVYFDEEELVVGIKFIKELDNGSFKLKHRVDGKGGYASAISFLKSYGLEKYFGTRITPESYEDEEIGQIFLLHLDKKE